jgi:hypothetical protein
VAEAGDIEGLLDSGGESGETGTNPGGADALAMAVAIEQAHHDPELSRKIGAYVRGGAGFSDRGINGFLAGRNRRNEVHEEAQT